MLIKFTDNTKDNLAAYINPVYVSAVLPRRNILTGEVLNGTYIYLVGGEQPVSVKEEIEDVVGTILKSTTVTFLVPEPPKEADNGNQ